ncbi:DUF4238 domain-containing protein [Blastococcus sp. SYSU DS0616]
MGEKGRPVARRHHTVPRFYLRGFAEHERVVTVRLPGEQRFPQSINDASVAKNFYAVAGHEDGDDVIEKGLSEVEGATAEVFKKIGNGTWPLLLQDRMALGYFVALQATRLPAQRRTMDHITRQVLRLEVGAGGKPGLRRRLEQRGSEVTDELVETLWKQATRPEGPPIERPNVEHIKQMIELADELHKYIVGRPWTLVQFVRRSLITSDAPVGLVPDPQDEPWAGVGYMTAWGITFPLTRKLGLLMGSPEPLIELDIPVQRTHEGATDTTRAGTTQLERFFNHHTVMNASEWLFHHPEDREFVPEQLPEPSPVNVDMSGMDHVFDGEPWFAALPRDAL